MTQKKKIRARLLKKLSRQSASARNKKSKLIEKKLFSNERFKAAKVVCFYVSLPEEVNTWPMIDSALRQGKQVVVPLTKFKERKLLIYGIKDRKKDLKPGVLGIQEPDIKRVKKFPVKKIDCVLVPGVAFDKQKNRLGHGVGLYDRFLKTLPKKAWKIGLAFDFQCVGALPKENHDVTMDMVLTNE